MDKVRGLLLVKQAKPNVQYKENVSLALPFVYISFAFSFRIFLRE